MKVLISLSYYYPHISGLSEYAKNLAEALAQSGNDIEVACCKHKPILLGKETLGGVKVRRFHPTIKLGKGLFSIGLVKWIASNLGKFDALIVNLPFPEAAAIVIIAKLTRTKVISIFHCDLDLGKSPIARLLGIFNVGVNNLVLQGSTLVVVNSMDYANGINYLNKYKDKIKEIPPLIRLSDQKQATNNSKKMDFKIGFLGRVAKEKNLETLIHAIETNKDKTVRLVLAGPETVIGEDDYAKTVSNKIHQLGSRAEVWGEVDEEQKTQFFNYIDILALPSDNPTESYGIVQVEAMAAGVPVITTNRPGVRDLVLRTGAGLVVNDPRDTTEWNEKIDKSRKTIGELSKKTTNIHDHYNSREILKNWIRLLNS